MTCTPAGFGVADDGANAIATFPINGAEAGGGATCPASAFATAAVVELSTCVHVTPPSFDRTMPCPLTPANRTRVAAGDDASRASDCTSPPPFVPAVQFCPPSFDQNKPAFVARFKRLLFAGS